MGSGVEERCGEAFVAVPGRKGGEYRVVHSQGTGADSGQYVAAEQGGERPWCLEKLVEGKGN